MKQDLKVTVVGCGGSTGVPDIFGDWGDCDPNNPKNHRTRNALYVEKGETNFLVDCGPDVRMQMGSLPNPPQTLTGLLLTHIHPDHTCGFYEMRSYAKNSPEGILNIYSHERCLQEMETAYPFMFFEKPHYPRAIIPNIIKEGRYEIGDITLDVIEMDHGNCKTLGYIFDEKIAYCTDVKIIADKDLEFMKSLNLDVFIIECTDYKEMHFHTHFDLALSWIDKIGAKMNYLTDLRRHMDYDDLNAKTPKNIEPAYDGLQIVL